MCVCVTRQAAYAPSLAHLTTHQGQCEQTARCVKIESSGVAVRLSAHGNCMEACPVGWIPEDKSSKIALSMNKIVVGKPVLLYHRSGHSPQPCY